MLVALVMMMSSLVGGSVSSTSALSHRTPMVRCAEDAVTTVTPSERECVHLEWLNDVDRTYAVSWITYCGTSFAHHRRVMMRYDSVGRLIMVRCMKR